MIIRLNQKLFSPYLILSCQQEVDVAYKQSISLTAPKTGNKASKMSASQLEDFIKDYFIYPKQKHYYYFTSAKEVKKLIFWKLQSSITIIYL